jgi:hypothetical protein
MVFLVSSYPLLFILILPKQVEENNKLSLKLNSQIFSYNYANLTYRKTRNILTSTFSKGKFLNKKNLF